MADFEYNPFELAAPGTVTTIEAIQLTSNLNWFNVPTTAITGPMANVKIDAKAMAPHLVFSTGSPLSSIPSLRLLEATDLPNIPMSQVIGLTEMFQTYVRTLTSANAYATVTHNAQGDHTLTVNVGTVGNTVAAGNDARFPSLVTGLRKGAGNASLDTAAVAKTDYWDTTTFVASGASHAIGLVPDPGATAGTTKFLCEDKTWKVPPGAGTVTSIGMTVPVELSVTPASITTSGTFAITKVNQSANLVYAGPTTGAAAAPTFRAHVYADISALVGTAANTIAAGNDTRFPANVTGLRKSSGAGSTDIAAVVKTDYWDASEFILSGPSAAKGLVPAPPTTAGTSRFLREDKIWAIPGTTTGSIDNSMLSDMPGLSFKANVAAVSQPPQDVSAKDSRALIGIEKTSAFGDINVTLTAIDRYVYTTAATFSTQRTVTLPSAGSCNPGQWVVISDDAGAIQTNSLLVARNGTDTIDGKTASVILDVRYSTIVLYTDGISKWSIASMSPSVKKKLLISGTSYTTPTGCKALYVECWGGGAGGWNTQASTAGNSSVSPGGGAGAYAAKYVTGVLKSSYSYAIGGGGGNAQNGGITTFDSPSICTADFGTVSGTPVLNGNTYAQSAASPGGTVANSIGDIRMAGGTGECGVRLGLNNAGQPIGWGGKGGDSPNGGIGGYMNTQTGQGAAGSGYGAGGAGGHSWNGATIMNGGVGIQGAISITEYY